MFATLRAFGTKNELRIALALCYDQKEKRLCERAAKPFFKCYSLDHPTLYLNKLDLSTETTQSRVLEYCFVIQQVALS